MIRNVVSLFSPLRRGNPSRRARRPLAALFAGAALTLASGALAFGWTPLEFPEGDQRYLLEVRGPDGAMTMEIVLTDTGDAFDAATVLRIEREGLSRDALGEAAFGGGTLGMLAFGPMMLFGPSFVMLPMMLGDEDIRVRSEPMRIMGIGSLHMERTEEVAGLECVVIRFEPDNAGPDEVVEFAVAEGVPFPCITRYGSGDGAVEVRLLEATR